MRRKHTRFGADHFRDDILESVARLDAFRAAEQLRITRMQETALTDTQAESWMLRAYERKLVSHRQLPAVIQEWREPTHEAFADRTLWSLYNGFTRVLADRAKQNPQAHAALTMRLQALLNPERN